MKQNSIGASNSNLAPWQEATSSDRSGRSRDALSSPNETQGGLSSRSSSNRESGASLINDLCGLSSNSSRPPSRLSKSSDQSRASSSRRTQTHTDRRTSAEMLADMHLAPLPPRRTLHLEASSSSAASSTTRPYSLVSRPPVVELSRSSFERRARAFHGDEILDIASNPQQYSPSVSSKAERTAEISERYGTTRFDSRSARYFSYQLGRKSAGLLRTEDGFSMSDVFEGEGWREQFPGRTEITSTVDLQITHPLVENAGDILLEHQLRIDGDRSLLNSSPANAEARDRAKSMGFVEVDDSNMVLDPTQHPETWTKNSDGEWQRANKPRLYLAKAASRSSGSSTSSGNYSSDDGFM